MRTGTPLSLLATAWFAVACGEALPAQNPSTPPLAEPLRVGKSPDPTAADAKLAAPAGAQDDDDADLTCRGAAGVGKSASRFSVHSVNGGAASLAQGKVTLLDFWATWCGPCQKSFPKYQELYVKYKSNGLEVVGLSVDDEKSGIDAFVKTHGGKFPVGWDEGHKIAECYQLSSMPTAYVIDKNGIVRHVHQGYRDGEEMEIEKEIKALL